MKEFATKVQNFKKEKEDLIILETSSWGGLGPHPSSFGNFITSDKHLYSYRYEFLDNPSEFPEHLDDIPLDEESYNKIIDYINNNLKGKSPESQMIFDAGWKVRFKDEDNNIIIENNRDVYNDTQAFITSFIKKDSNN